jgi:hypothetical protein
MAGIVIHGKNRLEIVNQECMQLIKYRGSKIEEVELISGYKEKEVEEEWKYKEFYANEYQTDLFFIRNSNRIKFIFNVIKKSDKYRTMERCRIEKSAMKKMIQFKEVGDDQILPYLYMEKAKWKKYKKISRSFVFQDKHIEEVKEKKWRARFNIKKFTIRRLVLCTNLKYINQQTNKQWICYYMQVIKRIK